MFGEFRKSSFSGGNSGSCVELAWRKSSRSGKQGNCVELALQPQAPGLIRDSKNPDGPRLSGDLQSLVALARQS